MIVKDSYTEASTMEYERADSLNPWIEPKADYSTSKALTGGNPNAEWNKIGSFTELNATIDAAASLREFTVSASANKNDGGFELEEDVLFYSKVDLQYIPGVIKGKKKDKLTKDYVYKIQKRHKRDPAVDEELAAKKRSAKEDPRVEIIKLREQRAKKMATITWNVKDQKKSYYKIMSANDFSIELQIALLNLLKSKLKEHMKRKKKRDKASSKADRIAAKNAKSRAKRDRKQKYARTFTGSRQEMMSLSDEATKRNSKKEDSHNSSLINLNDHSRMTSLAIKVMDISKPDGDPQQWSEEDVLTWLQWISQEPCALEKDESLRDEERFNLVQAREGLMQNYLDKFINAEIDGKGLYELDNKALSNTLYVTNALERRIILSCLEDLFGVRTVEWSGTDAKFLEWKESNIEEIRFQKRKAERGNMRHQTVSEIGINEDYVIPEYADKAIADIQGGSMYGERLEGHTGMDVEGVNKELVKMLLHANIPIPKELTTQVKGYHTIQNRNAQLRNLLMKHKAVMDEDAPWMARSKALQEARAKFERGQEKKTRDALKSGNLSEITSVYGTKHKKLKEIKQRIVEVEKAQKQHEVSRKWHERMKTNESGLKRTARLKKQHKSMGMSADLAGSSLLAVASAEKTKHRRKRSNSTDLSVNANRKRNNNNSNHIVVVKTENKKTPKSRRRKGMKRPKSAGYKSSKTMTFPVDGDSKTNGKKKRKNGKTKGVSVEFPDKMLEDKAIRRFKTRDINELEVLDLDYDASIGTDDGTMNGGNGKSNGDTPEIQKGYRHMLNYKKRHRNKNTSVVVNSVGSEDMLLSDLNDDGIDMMSDEEEEEDDDDDDDSDGDDDDDDAKEERKTPYLSPEAIPLSMRRLSCLSNASNGSAASSDLSDTTYDTAASWRDGTAPSSADIASDSTSSSSEITFSSDGDDDDDDDDDDDGGDDGNGSTVPLSVQRMRARNQIKKNRKNSVESNGGR